MSPATEMAWKSIVNAYGFEGDHDAKQCKILLAEAWGEQDVRCTGVIHRTGFANRRCPTCQGTGKVKDTRRRNGMRWLVENGKIPLHLRSSDRFAWYPNIRNATYAHRIPVKGRIREFVFPARYTAYHAASLAVGKLLVLAKRVDEMEK